MITGEDIQGSVAGFNEFNYATLRKKQRRAVEGQSRVSIALADTIAQVKEPTLFDNIDNDKELARMQSIDEKHLINREGKPTYLTVQQNKIVYALASILSLQKDDEEFKAHVAKVNSKKKTRMSYSFPVSITELTRMVSTEGKARARDKQRVIEELQNLSEIVQAQTYQVDDNEDKIRLTAPLIILKSKIEDLSPEKRLDADFIEVEFGRIFFYEIYNKYAIVKPKLFDIWGKAGSGTTTELFGILLSDLLGKWSYRRAAAITAAKKIKRNQYKTEESYFKAIAKVQKEALTYRELAATIRNRVNRDYESKRSYKAAFKKDLQEAIRALKEIELIKEVDIVNTPNGERIDFVFNIDYVKQDIDKVTLLAPVEE